MSKDEGCAVVHHPVRVIRNLANLHAEAPETSCETLGKAKNPPRKKKTLRGPARRKSARKNAAAAADSNDSDTEAGDSEAGDAEAGDPTPARPPSGMTAVCKSLQRARAKKRSKDDAPLSYADKLSRRLQMCRDMRGRKYNIKALRETRHKAVMKGFEALLSFFSLILKPISVVSFHVMWFTVSLAVGTRVKSFHFSLIDNNMNAHTFGRALLCVQA